MNRLRSTFATGSWVLLGVLIGLGISWWVGSPKSRFTRTVFRFDEIVEINFSMKCPMASADEDAVYTLRLRKDDEAKDLGWKDIFEEVSRCLCEAAPVITTRLPTEIEWDGKCTVITQDGKRHEFAPYGGAFFYSSSFKEPEFLHIYDSPRLQCLVVSLSKAIAEQKRE